MDVFYLDQSCFHQQGLSSLLKQLNITCCKNIAELKSRLSERDKITCLSPVIIFDLPANFRTSLTYIHYLTRVKNARNATLIFFSDLEKNKINYSSHAIKADCFIDKKSSTDIISSKLAIMLCHHKNGRSFASPVVNNHLTRKEFNFLCCLFTYQSIEGIAKITGENKKTLYSHQNKIVKKLNLKNSLHLYQRFTNNF
ncbi:LuxR family transcriptional regulator [Pantoea sp. BIGb0393]|uniref:LuxR family transcriptional regulator n=1 Tax=Pantoea nemavictus TaxID=2726955 RepID=A0ABU8PND5_9GAMM|nr:LuxR family transcriptional regulator [Pantoea nemavictus]MBA0035059.1 LuxR family transcriptional regulator [Pantoea nemavictus]